MVVMSRIRAVRSETAHKKRLVHLYVGISAREGSVPEDGPSITRLGNADQAATAVVVAFFAAHSAQVP